jgi:hypothetical protein
MTQHTSPVLSFHTDAIQRKKNSCILFTEHIHPRRYKRLFQQIRKKKFGSSLGFLLPLCLSSSIHLQQKLNYSSDAAEDH